MVSGVLFKILEVTHSLLSNTTIANSTNGGDCVDTGAPTMSEWGIIAFGLIAGLFAFRFLKKMKAVSA